MGINEFHDICGGATDGMATTETGTVVMPYKPRAGRKPECVGLFTFDQQFKLTKIEPVAQETGT